MKNATSTAAFALAITAVSAAGQTLPEAPTAADQSATISIALAALQTLSAAQPDKGAVVAPVAMHRLLGMLAAGADGDTAEAFRTVLGDQIPIGIDAEAYRAKASAWISETLGMADSYATALTEAYGASHHMIDFDDETEALSAINGWSAAATDGLVPTAIDELPDQTELVLLSAALFTGAWLDAFDPAKTEEHSFTLASGEVVPVAMVSGRQSFARHALTATAEIVSLPFEQEGISAEIILPTDLAALTKCLAPGDACGWMGGFVGDAADGMITMPRLKLESRGSLLEMLEPLGLGIAADAERSDFGAMTEIDGDRGPILAALASAAALRLDETGVEVAAVASATMATRSASQVPSFEMVVDRPYVVIIRDEATTAPLFVAYVPDPR